MFRCPSCGQARRMPSRNGEYYQPMTMDITFSLIKNLPPVIVTELNVCDVVVCPVCDQPNISVSWKEAWDNPMKYFEADNLCHCGGELWMDQVEGTPQYAFICEKCGWVKPKSAVSGAS